MQPNPKFYTTILFIVLVSFVSTNKKRTATKQIVSTKLLNKGGNQQVKNLYCY